LKHFRNQFGKRSASWVFEAKHVPAAHLGITNNVAESFNAVLQRLQKWSTKSVDCVALSLQ
jgi:hypothetical protein